MKNYLIPLFVISLAVSPAFAQESPDKPSEQNPNYQKSLDKYAAIKDSINSQQGTTAQRTYEAYDFMEEKRKNREERRRYRREHRYYNYGYYPYYSPYYHNRYSPYRYWNNWWF